MTEPITMTSNGAIAVLTRRDGPAARHKRNPMIEGET